jgi:hypothetical protein
MTSDKNHCDVRADSDTSGRIQPMPSEERQSWHYDTPTSLASYYRAKALPGDYGPAGLLEHGQRSRIRRSRRTVLRDYGPEEAASSLRRAVGTTGPFQGPRANREQRTPPSTPQGPQYLPRDYGPGSIRRTAMKEYTTASGRHDHATFRERADGSVRCSGFWAKASTRRSTNKARAG